MFDTYIFKNLSHTFGNIDDLHNYLLQGKAVISIISNENDCSEYCYTCLKPFSHDNSNDRIYVYHVETYNHNNSVYLGMIKDEIFSITRKSIYDETHPAAINFKHIWGSACSQDRFETNKTRIQHLGRCCYCGKKLLSDNERSIGYHADCRQSNYIYSPISIKRNRIITSSEVIDECPFDRPDNINQKRGNPPTNYTDINNKQYTPHNQLLGDQFTNHAEQVESDPNYWDYLMRQI